MKKAFSDEVMPVGSALVKWLEKGGSVQDWVAPDGIRHNSAAVTEFAKEITLFNDKRVAQDANRIFAQVLFNSRAVAIARGEVTHHLQDFRDEYERFMLGKKIAKTTGDVANIAGTILLFSGAGTVVGAAMLLGGAVTSISADIAGQVKQSNANRELKAVMTEDLDKSELLKRAMAEFGKLCSEVALRHAVATTTAALMIWASNANGAIKLGKKGKALYDAVQAARGVQAAESAFKVWMVTKLTAVVGKDAVTAFGKMSTYCSELATKYATPLVVLSVGLSVYSIVSTWAKTDPTLEVIEDNIGALKTSVVELEAYFKSLQVMDAARENPASAAALKDSDALIIGTVADALQPGGY